MTLQIPMFEQELGYTAKQDRQWLSDLFQEGVIDLATGLVVSAGGALTVNVSAGTGYVTSDFAGVGQGVYRAFNDGPLNSATFYNTVTGTNVGIRTADASFPRLDQVILRVYENEEDGGSGLRIARFEIVEGIATSGATLDNRSGAGALPATALRLSDVLIPAGAASISSTEIRDRRGIARRGAGVYDEVKVDNMDSTANQTVGTGPTNLQKVDATDAYCQVVVPGDGDHWYEFEGQMTVLSGNPNTTVYAYGEFIYYDNAVPGTIIDIGRDSHDSASGTGQPFMTVRVRKIIKLTQSKTYIFKGRGGGNNASTAVDRSTAGWSVKRLAIPTSSP